MSSAAAAPARTVPRHDIAPPVEVHRTDLAVPHA